MSTPNHWKTTEVRIAKSHVYLMSLMLDDQYPFTPQDPIEAKALEICISHGWIERGKLLSGNYLLTEIGKHVAFVCRAAIAAKLGDEATRRSDAALKERA